MRVVHVHFSPLFNNDDLRAGAASSTSPKKKTIFGHTFKLIGMWMWWTTTCRQISSNFEGLQTCSIENSQLPTLTQREMFALVSSE